MVYTEPPLRTPPTRLADQQQTTAKHVLLEFKDVCTRNLLARISPKACGDNPVISLQPRARQTLWSPYKLSQPEQLEAKRQLIMYLDKGRTIHG